MTGWRNVWKRLKRHKLAAIGMGVFLALLVAAIIVPWISPYEIDDMDLWTLFAPPSKAHPFGTDELGHDVLVRIMYGGRISLFVGIAAAVSSAFLGTLVGVVSGFSGGIVDGILMRFTDLMLRFHRAGSADGAMFLGGSLTNIIVILTISVDVHGSPSPGHDAFLRSSHLLKRASGTKTWKIL